MDMDPAAMTVQIEYGLPNDKEGLQLRFGAANGLFEKEGIEVSFRIVFGGPEIATLYDSGALKIGEMGSPPATTAISKGARFKIVGSGARRRAVQYFVASPSVKTWSDLRGGSVGVLSVGSCSYWFARNVLSHNGIDPDHAVKIVGMGQRYPTIIDAFDSNELQAAVISEPNVTIGERRSSFRVLQALTDPQFCANMQWGVIVANARFLEENPNTVAAILRGCKTSNRHARQHHKAFVAFGARHYGIDEETMALSLAREESNLHDDCIVDLEGLDLAIALQHKLGAFTAPLRADQITDLRHCPR